MQQKEASITRRRELCIFLELNEEGLKESGHKKKAVQSKQGLVLLHSFTTYAEFHDLSKVRGDTIGCLYWREVLKIEGQKYWVDFIYRVFHKEVSYYPKDCRCYLALKSLLNITFNV